ncbi:hypothetical protein GQ43DRAFT_140195 [Delitschia confertaspora ATCC 74209]|uniref:Uncharacterized protein n=1 Tax=Delitschia confertaspora ATCC 74209 TaxID=1513339 RepID=A0A9P4MQ14_9PLEO|nr:hypothetical protein GQ43DRAFT_140195 [Delitschia confertaspora ATCC 74209]
MYMIGVALMAGWITWRRVWVGANLIPLQASTSPIFSYGYTKDSNEADWKKLKHKGGCSGGSLEITRARTG